MRGVIVRHVTLRRSWSRRMCMSQLGHWFESLFEQPENDAPQRIIKAAKQRFTDIKRQVAILKIICPIKGKEK